VLEQLMHIGKASYNASTYRLNYFAGMEVTASTGQCKEGECVEDNANTITICMERKGANVG